MQKPLLVKKFEIGVLNLTVQVSNLLKLPYGLWILAVISFVESALLLPIITDPFLIAYILAHRSKTKALEGVFVTVATSILGGFVAYITASFFTDLILNYLSASTVVQFHDLVSQFHDSTFMLAFIGAVTPIPFTLTALVAGTIKGNLILFLFGALVGRMLRYCLTGYLVYRFGNQAITLIKQNIGLISILTLLICLLYFL